MKAEKEIEKTTPEYAPVSWVCEFLGGCSRSTVDRLRKNPVAEFPRP